MSIDDLTNLRRRVYETQLAYQAHAARCAFGCKGGSFAPQCDEGELLQRAADVARIALGEAIRKR
jgi:hypothetical protein